MHYTHQLQLPRFYLKACALHINLVRIVERHFPILRRFVTMEIRPKKLKKYRFHYPSFTQAPTETKPFTACIHPTVFTETWVYNRGWTFDLVIHFYLNYLLPISLSEFSGLYF